MRRTISRRLPRLSRRAKVLRNLALAAALVLAFCLLLHPGQTLYTQRDGGQSGEQWVFVLGDTYAYTGVVRNRDLGRSLFGRNAVLYQAISLDQSPGLLSLSGWDLLGGQRESWRLFCPNPPDRAVSARLTLRAPCLWRGEDGREESQTLRFSAEGERDAHGVVSFLVQADSLEGKMALCALMGGVGYEAAADNRWVRTCQDVQVEYRLEFWDAAGAPLPSAQGMLSGEAQKFPS